MIYEPINKYVCDIFEDLEYLHDAKFFHRNKDILFEVCGDQELVFNTDKDFISSIFQNIISNAVKYSDNLKKNKLVTVRFNLEDENLNISISDNGVGIPQNKQEITVQIDVIKVLPSGNQSISGHALDNHDHGFIMTVGKQSIFATIGTEDGVFNIRGNEDYAWVISSRELNHHLRPEILDYRVPKGE